MPVNTQHPDYKAMASTWQLCRDVVGGQKAMHAAAERYLPKLQGETAKDYAARKARALFFNATYRTVAGLRGMLMRKDPTVKVSSVAKPMLEDVTQSGLSLVDLAAIVAGEALTVGRLGLMVDYPRGPTGESLTVAQAEALNMRPKMGWYRTEAIINWDTRWVRNKNVLSFVVLAETAQVVGKDEFEVKSEARYRVLDLAQPPAAEGVDPATVPALAYRVRVFKPTGKKDEFVLVEGPFFPLMNGKPLEYIPFVFIGVDNTTPTIEDPPLVDLAYANVSHYQSTADVEHGAHKTALPQPYALGIDGNAGASTADNPAGKAKPTFYIGGSEIWLHPDAAGGFGMLEYTGQGLEAIEKRLERKEAHMAVLGARMLEDQKRGVETAEVAGMHRSGEQATLASQGKTASAGIRQALAWFDEWAGGAGGDSVEFALNDEFMPAGMTPQEMTALVGAWQSGALTSEELFTKFQKGGVINETITFATHASQIENEPPRLQAGAPDPDNPGAPGNTPPAGGGQ